MTSFDTRTPQERLSDGGWRLRHSLWMLPAFLSCGLLTWVGFLYVGITSRRKSWWIPGLGYFAAMVAGVIITPGTPPPGTVPPPDAARSDIAGGLIVAVWAAGAVHALIINRSWLRWRAERPLPWYASGAAAGAPELPLAPGAWQPPPYQVPPYQVPPHQVPQADPSLSYEPPSPSTQPPLPGPAPQQPVDVNTATGAQLAGLPGIGPARAEDIVRLRGQRGGFAGLDDFAAAAALAPHELARVRHLVAFSPFGGPAPGYTGRILDV